MKKKTMTEGEILNAPVLPKAVRKLKAKPVYVPACDNPMDELRRLVRQHKALVKASVAIGNMTSNRTNHVTGDAILCRLPVDAQVEGELLVKTYKKKANALASAMLKELRKIPIYRDWLSRVFIAKGPIMSAYLVAEINIHLAVKPSNLRRFCGLAVINGTLERRTKGAKNAYSSEMRMRLFQLFNTLWKGRRHSPDNKYLAIWDQYRSRIENSERVTDRGVDKLGDWTGKLVNGRGKTVSARGFAHSYGWHKAADVFLEDLYTVWRSIEGLPVWPSYYAAKLGYAHGGTISVNAPKMLTLPEALELVGDKVYGTEDVELEELEEEEELAAAAE